MIIMRTCICKHGHRFEGNLESQRRHARRGLPILVIHEYKYIINVTYRIDLKANEGENGENENNANHDGTHTICTYVAYISTLI